MPKPKADDVREFLEGYCATKCTISDAWIERRMDSFVIPWIERVTRQKFTGTEQIVEYYSGQGTSILVLNRRPIVSLDALAYTNYVEVDQFVINVNSIAVIADEGILKARYDFREDNWRPIFARGVNNIVVTYTYGFDDYPDDIKEAIIYFTAEQLLGVLANRTGGGTSVSTQGYNRSFGNRGKYTSLRNDLARQGHALLRNYMTAVAGIG